MCLHRCLSRALCSPFISHALHFSRSHTLFALAHSLCRTVGRFTAWVTWDKSRNTTDWTRPIERELFDLTGDTGRDFDFPGYSLNLANLPQYAAEVKSLLATLKAAVDTWA